MSFSSRFLKKKKNQWHYFPYGTVMEEISMPVVEGRKDALEKSLNAEMGLAISISFIAVGLSYFSPYLLISVLLVIPFLIYKRKNSIKKNCEYIHYPIRIWLSNYNKISIHFANPDSFRTLILGLFFFIVASIVKYLEEGLSAWTIILTIITLLYLYSIFICFKACKKQKDDPNYKKHETQLNKKVVCLNIIKYIFIPIIFVSFFIGYLYFANIQ